MPGEERNIDVAKNREGSGIRRSGVAEVADLGAIGRGLSQTLKPPNPRLSEPGYTRTRSSKTMYCLQPEGPPALSVSHHEREFASCRSRHFASFAGSIAWFGWTIFLQRDLSAPRGSEARATRSRAEIDQSPVRLMRMGETPVLHDVLFLGDFAGGRGGSRVLQRVEHAARGEDFGQNQRFITAR
jgi:hypothetical protein